MVAPVREDRQIPLPEDYHGKALSTSGCTSCALTLPAITHVDYSARIQSVSRETNPRYWDLINEFKKQTGCGVIVNTSFNVRGEPIVCTPGRRLPLFHAHRDGLPGRRRLRPADKREQPKLAETGDWRTEFKLD